MKRLDKPLSESYSPVKLFEEDLELIEDLLSSAKGLEIRSEEYEFSKLEELKKKYKNKIIDELVIRTDEPYLRIEFRKLRAELYVGSDNDAAAGLFYKIDSVIKAARRQPSFLYSYFTIVGGIWILGLSRYAFHGLVNQAISFIYYLFLVWAVWAFYIRASAHSQIVFLKRNDLKSYLEKNKYKLVERAIFLALGVVLTIIIQKLAGLL